MFWDIVKMPSVKVGFGHAGLLLGEQILNYSAFEISKKK